jgi:hypothetical protein
MCLYLEEQESSMFLYLGLEEQESSMILRLKTRMLVCSYPDHHESKYVLVPRVYDAVCSSTWIPGSQHVPHEYVPVPEAH